MQGIHAYDSLSGGVRLELMTSSPSTSTLAINGGESTEMRIHRLVHENPVVIFSRPSCYMCHVMRRLLLSLGVHPTVIELDEEEIAVLPSSNQLIMSSPDQHMAVGERDDVIDLEKSDVADGRSGLDGSSGDDAPAVFIGGCRIGGFESLVALHLGGQLVPKLVEAGVLVWV